MILCTLLVQYDMFLVEVGRTTRGEESPRVLCLQGNFAIGTKPLGKRKMIVGVIFLFFYFFRGIVYSLFSCDVTVLD